MEFSEFKTTIKTTVEVILNNRTAANNEAETISYLIVPLIAALGYSSMNPNEYRTEVPVSTPFKDLNETSKIDIVLQKQATPLMFVEAESQKGNLVKKGVTQVTSVLPHAQKDLGQQQLIGVLTDGIRYLFFADFVPDVTHKPRPFKELQLDKMDLNDYEFLYHVAKDSFNFDWLRNKYEQKTKLTNVKSSVEFLMNNPTDEFVKAVLLQMKEQGKISGNITSKVISDYKPAVISALGEFLSDTTGDVESVVPKKAPEKKINVPLNQFPVSVHLTAKNSPEIDAYAQLLDASGQIKVLKGSHIRQSDAEGYRNTEFESLLQGRVLSEDVVFSKPSRAANFILRVTAINGWEAWKDELGDTISKYRN